MDKTNLTVKESDFCKSLKPVGRILEQDGYYVWCCSPIYDDEGKVHVYYSRWETKYSFQGWLFACEVAHAVADKPEGPYTFVDVALKGRGGDYWDSWTVHNPSVYKIDGKYVMFYLGTNGSKLDKSPIEIGGMDLNESLFYRTSLQKTKRVGIVVADSLYGPWVRPTEKFLIDAGQKGTWDDVHTTNPAFIKTKNDKYRIYYKGVNSAELEEFHGNRRYGFAESDSLLGPYVKYDKNPVIDNSIYGKKVQCEDAYIWFENDEYHAIMRDMGVFNQEYGLYFKSADGIDWGTPQIAFYELSNYFDEPLIGLPREGRFERPQILMKDGKPQYMFCACMGGKYGTSSGIVLKIDKY